MLIETKYSIHLNRVIVIPQKRYSSKILTISFLVIFLIWSFSKININKSHSINIDNIMENNEKQKDIKNNNSIYQNNQSDEKNLTKSSDSSKNFEIKVYKSHIPYRKNQEIHQCKISYLDLFIICLNKNIEFEKYFNNKLVIFKYNYTVINIKAEYLEDEIIKINQKICLLKNKIFLSFPFTNNFSCILMKNVDNKNYFSLRIKFALTEKTIKTPNIKYYIFKSIYLGDINHRKNIEIIQNNIRICYINFPKDITQYLHKYNIIFWIEWDITKENSFCFERLFIFKD